MTKIGLYITQTFSHTSQISHKRVPMSQINPQNHASPLQASKKQGSCVVVGLFYVLLRRSGVALNCCTAFSNVNRSTADRQTTTLLEACLPKQASNFNIKCKVGHVNDKEGLVVLTKKLPV